MLRIITAHLRPIPANLPPGAQLQAHEHIPTIWLVCDYLHCCQFAFGPLDTASGEKQQASVAQFIAKARLEGWSVLIDGHYCPGCHKARLDNHKRQVEEAANASRITAANGTDLERLKRVLPPPGGAN